MGGDERVGSDEAKSKGGFFPVASERSAMHSR